MTRDRCSTIERVYRPTRPSHITHVARIMCLGTSDSLPEQGVLKPLIVRSCNGANFENDRALTDSLCTRCRISIKAPRKSKIRKHADHISLTHSRRCSQLLQIAFKLIQYSR
jgi:hypothetical protein